MKKFTLLFLCILFAASSLSFSQPRKGWDYHLTDNSFLYEEPSDTAETIQWLDEYDNVVFVDSTNTEWRKVEIDGSQGYVITEDISPGKAIVSESTYRTGARCEDGTSSSATGRGACSHHGGVDYWITETKTSVNIVDN